MRQSSLSPRTWFITGASRGVGRALALAALERGDRVVAAARTATTDDFDARHRDRVLALKLDVTDKNAVEAAVADAVARFGRRQGHHRAARRLLDQPLLRHGLDDTIRRVRPTAGRARAAVGGGLGRQRPAARR
ncbi:SDR family NAD(P)-dependent oxidoreductase [Promicromonospora iranensis]|uniref:SDR family NAD(P)-dependent oxidoreductase n=1 Tax=Promicromonospora iranensis TaxID=1105144 RepID=UPI0023A99ED7|nr:SDR family NAD(P)-dependent oxidoreductase [Promicromonospora iranensis]